MTAQEAPAEGPAKLRSPTESLMARGAKEDTAASAEAAGGRRGVHALQVCWSMPRSNVEDFEIFQPLPAMSARAQTVHKSCLRQLQFAHVLTTQPAHEQRGCRSHTARSNSRHAPG
jgi:hypothetical protein